MQEDTAARSAALHGQAEAYGGTVVTAKVPPTHVRLNDAFRDGEVHVAVSNKLLSKRNLA
jgi:hypothetical protein